ncbi:MAG: hypothetical protein ACTSUE_19245 [Promethearchaeota archaeon]
MGYIHAFPPYEPSRYLILIRDPFDAILATYHTQIVCGDRVEDDKWIKMPRDYTTCFSRKAPSSYFEKGTGWEEFVRNETKSYVRFMNAITTLDENAYHLVYYEDLANRESHTILATLEWLHGIYGNWMISPEQGHGCAMAPAAHETKNHRVVPVHEQDVTKYYTETQVQDMCKAFKDVWRQEKFGACDVYRRQRRRELKEKQYIITPKGPVEMKNEPLPWYAKAFLVWMTGILYLAVSSL